MNTGYNFNSEVTELYSDNVFENVVSATDSDKYFRNFYNSRAKLVPAFVNDNISYTLYNGEESLETDMYGYHIVDSWDSGNTYYNLTGKVTPVTINNKPYEKNTFWKQTNKGYKLDPNIDFDRQGKYYDFTVGKDKDMKPITDSVIDADENTTLHLFFVNDSPPTVKVDDKPLEGLFYEINSELYAVNENTRPEVNMQFYWVKGYTMDEGVPAIGAAIPFYNVNNAIKIPVVIVEKPEKYYTYNDIDKALTIEEDVDYNKIYYSFTEEPVACDIFYEPNKYYYAKGDKNYLLSIDQTNPSILNPNITGFYIIDEDVPTVLFYQAGKYYYKENETDSDEALILDHNEEITVGRQYYEYSDSYVISDSNGILSPGAVWNSSANRPESVTIGGRKEIYVWKELKGFAEQLNTAHGLILEINKILKTGDTITRDTNTV
jgi:hypothetical protein